MPAPFPDTTVNSRIARLVEDLDNETLNAIAAASVPHTYAHLDLLLKDWHECIPDEIRDRPRQPSGIEKDSDFIRTKIDS